jgi:flagellar hook-associated protein 2
MPSFSIDGINSKLDTTAIIDSIINFERNNAVLLERRIAETTNEVTTLKALQAKIVALDSAVSKLTRARNFETSFAKMSQDGYLTASTTGRVGKGSYDLRVLSLARNHQIASQGFNDQSLADLGSGTVTIQVGEKSSRTITVDAANNSLVGLKSAINEAKAGVTASIINDGTGKNPYRLVLTADDPGYKNRIKVDFDLVGGTTPNFSTGSFDQPEEIAMKSGSSATVSLGTTASYSGDQNKIYAFTVQGSNELTVGTDEILIDWTDGTNSGTISVTQADTEVALFGDGADGLKISIGSGSLNGGDLFQVQSFAPTLQEATDARISLGGAGGAGSPIVVSSATNEFKNVIENVNLVVEKETAPGETLTLTTNLDVNKVKEMLQEFIDKYNEVVEFIDKQNKYNQDTGESGALFGDFTVQQIQSWLRSSIGNRISGLDARYSQLYSVGVRSLATGRLSLQKPDRLEEALRKDLDAVINLFTNSGSVTGSGIEFVSSTSETVLGNEPYKVNITQAASRGYYQGTTIQDPASSPLILDSSNNKLRFKIDSVVSDEIVLEARTYNSASELVSEIQTRIDNDQLIGAKGLTVEWVDTGSGSGYLKFNSSTYGSSSKAEMDLTAGGGAFSLLGLASGSAVDGLDVEGTINGEAARGRGQILTGEDGNETTAGLAIKVTLTAADLQADAAEGEITLTRGIGASLDVLLDKINATGDGTIDRKIAGLERQVRDFEEQVEAIDKRLELRRERLYKEFWAMESALGELQAQSSFLDSQLASINANWWFGKNSKK